MRLTFLGATDTVTGSRFLVETGDARVLVDCGMFQGVKKLRRRNWEPLGPAPHTIDAVLLTHAHLDHSGWLPRLVRDGFNGPIWCTPLTASLLQIMLRDAAYLAEEEARHRNKHGTTRHRPALPLYTTEDAELALSRVRTKPFSTAFGVAGALRATFTRAGHILGASCVRASSPEGSVAFTGDVGRPDDPVMLPPEPLPGADVVVTESTYGDRTHPNVDVPELLAEVVTRTVQRGGSVLVPAFAVGRAQTLLHLFAELRDAGAMPAVPIHLNSPMAINVTELLLDAIGEHRLDAPACRRLAAGVDFVRTAEGSKQLTATGGPRIVVTASGMLTGGRVLHHLLRVGPDERSTILLPGFQAAGTRGRQLAEGAETVKVFGRQLPIRAEVVQLDALSAHADRDQLTAWLAPTSRPRRAYVVHGEPHAADMLRHHLADRFGWDVEVPGLDQTVDVLAPSRA